MPARLSPAMLAAVRAPRGRYPDNASAWAGRYLVHANARTTRSLCEQGLCERIFDGQFRAFVLTPTGEQLREQLRAAGSS